jgi:hypothetical protein
MQTSKLPLQGAARRRIGLWALCGLLAAPSVAQAYVRSRATSCKPVYWAQSCLYIQADSNYVKDLSGPEVEQAIQNSINAWQTHISPASFLQLKYLPAQGVKETTYKDGLQVVKFRADQWCRPASDGAQQVCYDRSATAITTVSYINKAGDPNDGQIVDADIELNAVNNIFFNADKGKAPADPRNPADLWNTLTHEMGHMQGLDHTCRGPSEPTSTCTVDNTGAMRPLCSDVARLRLTNPAYMTIYDSTMYAVADPSETRKRVPQTDDVRGITDSYPASNDPKSCVLPGSAAKGGCAAAAPAPGAAPISALYVLGLGLSLGLTLAVLRRRRPSQRLA